MTYRISLPWPPSVNSMWRCYRGRNILSKAGREWFAAAAQLVQEQWASTVQTPIRVEILVYPPDRRKRDIDNLAKPCLDALVKGMALADDSLVDMLSIERRPSEKPGRVEIAILPLYPRTQYRD